MNAQTRMRLLFVLGLFAPMLSYGQGVHRVDIYVDDGRPIAKAVTELTSKYLGVVVTYEDARYAYREDVKDITLEVRREASADLPPIVVPLGGSLSFHYSALASGEPADWRGTLESILQAYHQGTTGSRFALLKTGDAFHIVPVQHRDARGQLVQQASVLDSRITLAPASLNGLDMVNTILAATSKASGYTIHSGLVNDSRLFRYQGVLEAVDQSARDVLVRTLSAAAPKLAWQLFYDPGGKVYFLNIHSVAEPPPPRVPVQRHMPGPDDPRPATRGPRPSVN